MRQSVRQLRALAPGCALAAWLLAACLGSNPGRVNGAAGDDGLPGPVGSDSGATDVAVEHDVGHDSAPDSGLAPDALLADTAAEPDGTAATCTLSGRWREDCFVDESLG